MKTYLLYGRASRPSEGENQLSGLTVEMTLLIKASGTVLDCEISGCGQLMNTFVADMVKGKSISSDVNAIVQEIETRVVSATARELLVKAIQSLQKDCLESQIELQWGSETENNLQNNVRVHLWESLGDKDTM